ncbi:MAG: triose-phosphate isomerase [Chloroflexota bacterium]|nr:triose-phosphate isomerase [Chloroflexota bacterium]
MRTLLIAGNWKMNTTIAEAVALVNDMKGALDGIGGVEKLVCPPFVSLATVADVLRGSSTKVGAQNMYFEKKGAYTGEISPSMLSGLCEYVIIGHSERRQYFGETDETVNKKVRSALDAGLKPIICIGENLDQNRSGRTQQIVTGQARDALKDIEYSPDIVIAYEPIWAIGTGMAATGVDANTTIDTIRRTIAGIYGDDLAQKVRILYGGSVNAANAAEFIGQPEIDGGLVGGASLKAAEFISMVEQTASIRK